MRKAPSFDNSAGPGGLPSSNGRPAYQYNNLPLPPPFGSRSIVRGGLHQSSSSDNLPNASGSSLGPYQHAPPVSFAGGADDKLEVELRAARLEATQARAALQQGQQRSSALAAEVASVEADRLTWMQQMRERDYKLEQMTQQSRELQQKLSKAEAALFAVQQAMEGAALERDAAVVAKEDLAAQLRVLRKRLHEAEEEQYRAEEDTAALRSELRALQEAADVAPMGQRHLAQLHLVEEERDRAKHDLEEVTDLLQSEQSRLAFERQRGAAAQQGKDAAEKALAAAQAQALEVQQILEKALAEAHTQAQKDREGLEQALALAHQQRESAEQALSAAHANLQEALASRSQSGSPSPSPPTPSLGPPAALDESLPPPQVADLERESRPNGLEQHRQVASKQVLDRGAAEVASSSAMSASEHEEKDSQLADLQDEIVNLKGLLQAQLVQQEQQELEMARLVGTVERLESSRKKLLLEVDIQSAELERLFGENAGLATGFQETAKVAASWEVQVKEALETNSELRRTLSQLREENARLALAEPVRRRTELPPGASSPGGSTDPPQAANGISSHGHAFEDGEAEEELEELRKERQHLKLQLAQAESRSDELSGQVAQLTAENAKVTQTLGNVTRLYKPMLANIEARLLQVKMKQIPGRS